MEELRLQFTGNNKGLKKQFKIWCAEADKQMTPTIMEFINRCVKDKKHLNKVSE